MIRTCSFLAFTVCFLVASNSDVVGQTTTGPEAAKRPNVIIVMTDDQGYGDFSFVGSPVLKTPNLDSLAKQSTRLNRFYVHPVCTPTRAALMTGRYPQRTGAYDTYIGRAMMFPKETTVAELMKTNGYTTGIFGKWHLGDCYPMRASDQGFDYSIVHKGGGLAQPSDPIENKSRYTNPILFQNNQQKQFKGYCTDIFFDHAIAFMENASKKGTPFFTYIATNAPHGPFHDVPKASLAKYSGIAKNNKEARIFAMIDNVDQNIGKLTRFLKQNDLEKDTILIFLTDNGPNTARFVGPFRGNKGQTLEGGIRTTFLARWPGQFGAGSINETTAANIDLLPTIAAATGTKIPKGLELDGINILPILKGHTPTNFPINRSLVFQWHRGEPVRGKSFATIAGKWKLRGTTPQQPAQLFDLLADPKELKNLAPTHPDVVKKLRSHYKSWYDSLADGQDFPYTPKPIIIGSKKELETAFTKQDWVRTKGKSWGSLGHWHVQCEQETTFMASIVLRRASKKRLKVELSIGDQKEIKEFPKGLKRLVFEQVKVPQMAGKLEASLTSSQPIPGFYQLILKQKSK